MFIVLLVLDEGGLFLIFTDAAFRILDLTFLAKLGVVDAVEATEASDILDDFN